MQRPALALFSLLIMVKVALAAEPQPPASPVPAMPMSTLTEEEYAKDQQRHSFGHKLLFYIPNRIFDVFDLVRARVRVGPGMAIGARATKLTDLYMGSYASVYVGLPGPRQKPTIPWPVGVETRSGLAASLADATVSGPGLGPNYSPTEFGLGFQAVLVGCEVGLDPLEVFDLLLGIFFIDLRGDDL